MQGFTVLETYTWNPLLTPDCHKGFWEAAADQTPLVIRYGCARGQPPPRCRGTAEAKELYNPLFI